MHEMYNNSSSILKAVEMFLYSFSGDRVHLFNVGLYHTNGLIVPDSQNDYQRHVATRTCNGTKLSSPDSRNRISRVSAKMSTTFMNTW